MINRTQNVLNCRLNVNARSLNGFKHDCFLPHALVNCLLLEALSVYVNLFTDERDSEEL